MLNAKIRITFGKLCSFELCSIICQNSSGHTKSVYDALQELDRCLLGYIYCWHDLHPFSERVNSDEQISKITWSPGQDAHDVDSPDCEWSGDINRSKRISMLHCLLLKELAISAFLHDFHCVILCSRPVKSVPEGFTDDRGTMMSVIHIHPCVHLPAAICFFSGDTLHHHHPIGTLLK
jgi:hypothetical protein